MNAPALNGSSLDDERLTALTNRQQQVATLVCDGLSNKKIARKLGVSEGTVKIYLYLIYKKLDVRSRTDLIASLWHIAASSRLNN